jgi:hypothetical protein
MCDSCQHTVYPEQCNTDAAAKETFENLGKCGITDSGLCFGIGRPCEGEEMAKKGTNATYM